MKTFKLAIRGGCVVPALFGAAIATPLAVHAQAQADTGLEEVVVTAQRREENLQQVPIAASAFSADQIEQRGVRSIEDLQYQAPALSVQEQGFLKFVNIRGVGLQAVNPSTSSGVAFYSDGFFIPHETAIGEAYLDLERVEVLRGPQGTLVGQNSTGGAIYVVSKKPEFDRVKGTLEQTVGDYNWTRTRGAVNVPLGEDVAVRVAANVERRDSFYDTIAAPNDATVGTSPSQPGNLSSQAARMQLRWEPGDVFQLNLKQEFENRSSDGTPAKAFAELASPSDPRLADPFTLAYNVPTKNDYQLNRTTLEMNWQLSDTLSLRSMTGYQHQESKLLYDFDGSALPIGTGTHYFFEDTFEQEFNLISSGDSRLQWILGAFYMHDRLPVQLDFNPVPGVQVLQDSKPKHTSYSLFGQATYDFSDHWQLLVGARGSHDKKEGAAGSGVTGVRLFDPVTGDTVAFLPSNLDNSTDSTEPTGKVALNWFISDDTTVYASVSKGYKSGGLNDVSASGGARNDFDPETVIAYEAGWKTTLADRHLRVTSAVFYYDYQDFQLTVFDAVTQTTPIANAGNATLQGAEVEITAQFGGFGANVAAAYTDSEVDQLALGDNRGLPPGVNPVLQDLSGVPVNFAPEWTVSAGIEYAFPLGTGTLTPRAQYSYKDVQYAGVFHVAPLDIIPSHRIIDARLTYRSDDNWWLEGFVTNADDELYIGGIQLGNSAIWGAPRQVGLRAGVEF